jgi:hypothetical protein
MHKSLLAALLTSVFVPACASKGIPVEAPISSAEPVTLLVPKGLEGADGPLKGISLGRVNRVTAQEHPIPGATFTANTIQDFYSVDSNVPSPGLLITAFCQGELYDDGQREQSCVTYQARVDIAEEAEQYRISITPQKTTTQAGTNTLGIALDVPQVGLDDWYTQVLDQSVVALWSHQSSFPPEALKASFDRKLQSPSEGSTDGALKQFDDTYVIPLEGGMQAEVSAKFAPHQHGSVVEARIVLPAHVTQSRNLDWTKSVEAVKATLQTTATE